jgi:hypothetical protein
MASYPSFDTPTLISTCQSLILDSLDASLPITGALGAALSLLPEIDHVPFVASLTPFGDPGRLVTVLESLSFILPPNTSGPLITYFLLEYRGLPAFTVADRLLVSLTARCVRCLSSDREVQNAVWPLVISVFRAGPPGESDICATLIHLLSKGSFEASECEVDDRLHFLVDMIASGLPNFMRAARECRRFIPGSVELWGELARTFVGKPFACAKQAAEIACFLPDFAKADMETAMKIAEAIAKPACTTFAPVLYDVFAVSAIKAFGLQGFTKWVVPGMRPSRELVAAICEYLMKAGKESSPGQSAKCRNRESQQFRDRESQQFRNRESAVRFGHGFGEAEMGEGFANQSGEAEMGEGFTNHFEEEEIAEGFRNQFGEGEIAQGFPNHFDEDEGAEEFSNHFGEADEVTAVYRELIKGVPWLIDMLLHVAEEEDPTLGQIVKALVLVTQVGQIDDDLMQVMAGLVDRVREVAPCPYRELYRWVRSDVPSFAALFVDSAMTALQMAIADISGTRTKVMGSEWNLILRFLRYCRHKLRLDVPGFPQSENDDLARLWDEALDTEVFENQSDFWIQFERVLKGIPCFG